MSGPPDLEGEDRRWLREAEEELQVAEHLVLREELPPRSGCFHAHLAAEKAIRALLVHGRRGVPRVHDLVVLERMLGPTQGAALDPSDLDLLGPWSSEGRYPADLTDVARERANEVAAAAARVVEAARRFIQP
jgi:HEPN domain-containing protein